jgi:flagellar motor switch protein FliM
MIEVERVSTETIKFGDFMQQFSHPTNFNIFTMDPLIGSGVVVFEPGLVFSLIDCMFGGDGKPLDTVREFTLIELRMIRKFVSEILNDLKSAWKIAIELNIKLVNDESKPEFVNIATPNDLMVVIVFAIKGGEFAGNIHLCMPYMMLEPIKSKLSTNYMREMARQHIFSAQIQSLLKDSSVTVVAELGRTVQTVRDILNFEIDDILKLNNGPDDPIRVTVEDVPKFIGSPGVVKGNRAVQIINPIENNGG